MRNPKREATSVPFLKLVRTNRRGLSGPNCPLPGEISSDLPLLVNRRKWVHTHYLLMGLPWADGLPQMPEIVALTARLEGPAMSGVAFFEGPRQWRRFQLARLPSCSRPAHDAGAGSDRPAPPNIRSPADLHQHWCRPTSAPMRTRYILFSISFYSPFFYLWGTPRDPVPLPDRSPPPIRDFRPLIPAHGGGRLYGRPSG